ATPRDPSPIFVVLPRRPRSLSLFPYTTLFRSRFASGSRRRVLRHGAPGFVVWNERDVLRREPAGAAGSGAHSRRAGLHQAGRARDRKSTRLNSSHLGISYAVFCLKKKTHNSMA